MFKILEIVLISGVALAISFLRLDKGVTKVKYSNVTDLRVKSMKHSKNVSSRVNNGNNKR